MEGIWKNGKLNGKGKIIKAHGKFKYEGYFVDSMQHGYGVSELPNGTKYSGHWQDNWMHGYGIMSFE